LFRRPHVLVGAGRPAGRLRRPPATTEIRIPPAL